MPPCGVNVNVWEICKCVALSLPTQSISIVDLYPEHIEDAQGQSPVHINYHVFTLVWFAIGPFGRRRGRGGPGGSGGLLDGPLGPLLSVVNGGIGPAPVFCRDVKAAIDDEGRCEKGWRMGCVSLKRIDKGRSIAKLGVGVIDLLCSCILVFLNHTPPIDTP